MDETEIYTEAAQMQRQPANSVVPGMDQQEGLEQFKAERYRGNSDAEPAPLAGKCAAIYPADEHGRSCAYDEPYEMGRGKQTEARFRRFGRDEEFSRYCSHFSARSPCTVKIHRYYTGKKERIKAVEPLKYFK